MSNPKATGNESTFQLAVCRRRSDIRGLSAEHSPACRLSQYVYPRLQAQLPGASKERDRLEEAFSNRPRDGNRQPTNSCLFPAGMAPGKRERGLGATRLVPNDPFCPLPIRGRHGNEPRLPEAREMGRRQSPIPNPPSSPSQEDLSHAGPGGAWRGGSTRCQLSKKEVIWQEFLV